MPLNFQFSATGASQSDIEESLEIAIRQVREGYTSGFDRNEDGSYQYDLSGTAENESDD